MLMLALDFPATFRTSPQSAAPMSRPSMRAIGEAAYGDNPGALSLLESSPGR
jgi:hypothetical protein